MSTLESTWKPIAESLNLVKPSPTLALTSRIDELRREGKKIIGLGAGEPDFAVPDHIKEAAIQAIVDNKNTYTPPTGILPLREAISEKIYQDYHLTANPKSEVMVGCGGKQLLFLALQATLNPDDEVIVPAPYWVSYPDMVLLSKGKPILLRCSEDNNFKINADMLAKSITDKSKWLILNSPNNPTGETYTKSELQAILNVVEKHPNLGIISDDIYEHLVYDDTVFHSIASLTNNKELLSRILIVNGFSKAFCMTGWRLGWAYGNQSIIKAMTMLASQSTTHPTSIVQYAGISALKGSMDFLTNNVARFAIRRDFVVNALNGITGISCRKPTGAFYVYPNVESLINKSTATGKKLTSDADVANYFLEEGIATVPGIAFGLEPYIRISYATSDQLLEQAMQLITKSIDKLNQ